MFEYSKAHYGKPLSKTSNLRSCPSSLYSDAAKEGMIHLLDGSYVQKPDSGFFSDWSRNNTPETLRSYWLSYFNEISGLRVG